MILKSEVQSHTFETFTLERSRIRTYASILIREASFGEREHHMHSQYLLPKICLLQRGALSRECPVRERPL